jgi:hypothetical protein
MPELSSCFTGSHPSVVVLSCSPQLLGSLGDRRQELQFKLTFHAECRFVLPAIHPLFDDFGDYDSSWKWNDDDSSWRKWNDDDSTWKWNDDDSSWRKWNDDDSSWRKWNDSCFDVASYNVILDR